MSWKGLGCVIGSVACGGIPLDDLSSASSGHWSGSENVSESSGAGGDPDHWVQISLGNYHSCGIRGDGALWCWGAGEHGRRGDGTDDTSSVPTRVLAAGQAAEGSTWRDWVQVSAGSAFTCGIRRAGTLWCWGAGSSGELGEGAPRASALSPRQVQADSLSEAAWSDWRSVSAGGGVACGVREDGSLWCWGFGEDGRLGIGHDGDDRALPTRVVASGEPVGGTAWSDWTHVSVGARHSCGLRIDGSAWCWGRANSGERGDGVSAPSA
jgi:alpha-tubulin suppressor-like RCC1 family protein